MPRRRAITDAQLQALLALPTTEPDLIRHYTLGPADLAVIARRRRPHNRLGFAIQLCALRFPGRLLSPGEVVPRQVLVFIAEQLDVDPDTLENYATRAPTRYDQLEALQSIYGFRRRWHSRSIDRCSRRHGITTRREGGRGRPFACELVLGS